MVLMKTERVELRFEDDALIEVAKVAAEVRALVSLRHMILICIILVWQLIWWNKSGCTVSSCARAGVPYAS